MVNVFDEYRKQTRPTRLTERGRAVIGEVPKATGPTVSEAITDFVHWHRNKGSSPSTIRNILFFLDDRIPKRVAYLPFLAWCNAQSIEHLSQLTKSQCQTWLDQMRDLSEGKQQGMKSVIALKRFLAWAKESELVESVPIKLIEPKRPLVEIAVFTSEEMSRLAKEVHKENPRDWAIFCVMLDTGIRSNELTSLKVEDLRLDRRELAIPDAIAKGGKFRVVPLKDSIPALKAYLRERGEIPGVDWLFLSFMAGASPVYAGGTGRNGRRQLNKDLRDLFSPAPLSKNGLYHLTRKWGELASVSEARNSPHTYRHFFAVTYLRNGGDVFSLQRILGHTKLEMTQRYARLAEIDVRRIHSSASPLSNFIPARNRRAVIEED
jgi:integrase/recombinase XerD